MKLKILHDKNQIERFYRRHESLHFYEIGDLDNFYWNHTIWYGLESESQIKSIVLLYTGFPLPVLLALSDKANLENTKILLKSVRHLLPQRIYAHLSPNLNQILSEKYALELHGNHLKMVLSDNRKLHKIDTNSAVRLTPSDTEELKILYEKSYPENSFDPRMLDTGEFFGIKQDDTIVSVAGIHVYSEEYKIAAIGNITTHPDFRGHGFGTTVTARLCKSLLKKVETIGLNVKSDNIYAIKSYQTLGFEKVDEYFEYRSSPGV
jgi:ribosomal protein S18 acetylase RimI-like enzyme